MCCCNFYSSSLSVLLTFETILWNSLITDMRLSDDPMDENSGFLRQDPNAYVGNKAKCRRFVDALKWISRSGAPWRLLPAEFGNWNSVYKPFARWCDRWVW
jgi:transposase